MKTICNNAAAGSWNLLLHCYFFSLLNGWWLLRLSGLLLFLSAKRLVVAQIELVVPAVNHHHRSAYLTLYEYAR